MALNAAVEAGRVGDQGRCCGVAASEVHSLAGRSATAAKEIKGLIDASVSNISHGCQQVEQAGAMMQMYQVSQSNAARVEEAAAAAQSLEHQAQGLVEAVSVFKVAA